MNSPILSFSVGAARLFDIEGKDGKRLHRTMINSGTYVVMDNGPEVSFQKTLMHCVPPGLKTAGNQPGRRWNFTFRAIEYDERQQQLARMNKRTRDDDK